jgi:predicted outer membrane repeat protein
VTVTDSLLHDNRAENVGGGLWNLTGRVVMTRTTVSANRAFEGGGINSYGDHVELYTVNVINNQATGSDGGGIYHTGGTFFVTNATISGNRAKLDGGGIHQNSGDNLVLRNVTISGNQAERFGGGFHHRARFAILTNVTLGNNTAPAGNALYESADGSVGPGVLQLTNTLIFGSANNCDGNLFQSGGHNLTAGSCSSLANATDRQVSDAMMGTLTYNGGFFVMQTHLPLTGSPAINGGDSASCSATDQRGAARVGVCDVGAVEADAALPRGYLPLITK